MIVWVNGPFGGGKTTTANALTGQRPSSCIFDPEHVGYMLAANFKDVTFDDFQELPPWRRLVPAALAEVERFTQTPIVAPQSVLVESYWTELRETMVDQGLDVFHVVLDVNVETLTSRITNDEVESQAVDWRLDHRSVFDEARSWLGVAADLVIDTSELTPDQVADQIWSSVEG